MLIKEAIEKLEKTEEFKVWNESNTDSYLVHVFKMLDSANVNDLQVGYYSPDKHMITTFIYDERAETITINPDAEIFKETDKKIEKLELDKITMNLPQAMHKVEKLQSEKYSAHPVEKAFIILQTLDVGTVYNFTFVTKTFHVLNFKLDAISGLVVEEKLSSIFDFKDKALSD